jgi:hypothetical protein
MQFSLPDLAFVLYKDLAPRPFHLGCKGMPQNPGEVTSRWRASPMKWDQGARLGKGGVPVLFCPLLFLFVGRGAETTSRPHVKMPGVGSDGDVVASPGLRLRGDDVTYLINGRVGHLSTKVRTITTSIGSDKKSLLLLCFGEDGARYCALFSRGSRYLGPCKP